MNQKKTPGAGRVFFVIVAALVALLVLVPALCIGLSLLPPSLPMKTPVSSASGSALDSIRLSASGIELASIDLESALARALAENTVPSLTLTHTGACISPDTVAAGAKGSWRFPARVPLLGNKTIPVSATATFTVVSGTHPAATLRSLSIGRLPLPLALFSRFISTQSGAHSLPEGISLTGMTVTVDAALVDLGPIRVREVRFTDKNLMIVPDIPETAGTDLLAVAKAKINANTATLHAEAVSSAKSSGLAALVLALAPLATRADSAVAVVEYAAGDASVRYTGTADLPLRAGDRLMAGATLSTGADSALEARLADRSLLSLAENTSATVTSVGIEGNGDTAIGLKAGSVLARVARMESRGTYRIATTSVSAGVAGAESCEILVMVNDTGSSTLAVAEGTVPAESSGSSAAVTRGKEITANEPGTLSAVTGISAKNRKLMDTLAFRTPASLLEEALAPDPMAQIWTVARPLAEGWKALDTAEQKRLKTRYGTLFRVDEIARTLGVSKAELERIAGSF